MPRQAIELMFGAYRRQLLAALLQRPDERFHVRELARMTGIPAGSIHRELKALFETGLLLREQLGNQVMYQANADHQLHAELALIFRKTIGLATPLGEVLGSIAGRIRFALVFGSMASGHQDHSSDVDVLVLGDASLTEVIKALAPAQASLGREINPVTMSLKKFAGQLQGRDQFAMRVVKEPHIFVIGEAREFAEFTENGTTV